MPFSWSRRCALTEDAGALSEIGSRTLPQKVIAGGVGQIIRRHLSRVPDDARPLLQEMAVAGRWLDLNIMGAPSGSLLSHPIRLWILGMTSF